MDKDKKDSSQIKIVHGTTRKKLSLFRLMSVPLLLGSIIFAVWYFSCVSSRSINQPNSYCIPISEWSYYDANGEEVIINTPFHLMGTPRGVPFSFYATLPDTIKPDALLSFLTSRHYQVYIDGKLRYEFNPETECKVPGGIVKRVHSFTPLFPEDAGKRVEYRSIDTVTDNALIDGTFIGDSLGITKHYLNSNFFYFSACLILIVFAVLTIIISVGCEIAFNQPMNLLTMACSVLIGAIWLMLDNESFQFLSGELFIDGTLGYLAVLLIPFPFLTFLNELQNHRHSRSFFILNIGGIICFLTFTFLHFTGIYSYRYSVKYIDIYLALIILAAVILSVRDSLQGHYEEYKQVSIGFIIFTVSAVVDIIRVLVGTGGTTIIFIPIGMFAYMFSSIIQAIVIVVQDDAYRKEAMAASSAKTRFLANMSHEIRTPINSILGINEMILKEETDPKILEYASMIRNSGKTLLGLVTDVLDFSKIEAGKMEIVTTEYKSASFLHDLIDFMHDSSDKKGVESRINISPNIPSILKGDEVHLRQILINILSNAYKYTHEGYVELTAYIYDGSDGNFHLSFSIKDSGMGIKEDEIDNLFDAFTRADINKNRAIQGTGLGLSIVKQLTEAMGGSITVKSKYGEGSVFTIDVPQEVIDAAPVNDAFNKVEIEDKERFKVDFEAPDKRILAVDDTMPNLIIIREFLKDTKVQLDIVRSGIKALELTQEKQYDLIFMDHMMPIMDGIETFKKIKSDKNNPNRETPVIILTANAIAGSREHYLNEGFSDYLSKPIEMKQLLDITKSYIAPSFDV